MREGAARASGRRERAVSANGPTTFVANVSSIPSAESVRSATSAPALWTRTSSASPAGDVLRRGAQRGEVG